MKLILRIFVSLKTAVATICILVVLSMLGTFIPQSLEAHQYLSKFPKLGYWILALGFDDMYHSFIFQFCLWFLSISTIVCILTRWKSTKRKLFNRIQYVSDKEIKAFECGRMLEKPIYIDEALKAFDEIRDFADNTKIALRTRGKASLLGGMFIHIGFLAILAGGLIGLFYGVEMAVRGRAGDRVPIPELAAIRAARDADRLSRIARNIRHFSPNAPILNEYRTKVANLHQIYSEGLASAAFHVEFKKLWVDHHVDANGQIRGIKSWNSAIKFIINGQEVASGVTKVNQPISFMQYSFYQANWNKIFRRVKLKVDLINNATDNNAFVTANATFPVFIELKLEEPQSFEWTPLKLVLHDFMPDFRIIDGKFISISDELNNPAARIIAYDQAGSVAGRAWAFPEDRIISASHVSNLPFIFTFVDAEPEFESGLQMTYDPGKTLVWTGCLLFTLGLIMSFYIAYREEYLLIYPDGRKRIAVYGNRPLEQLLKYLDNLENELCSQKTYND